MKRLLIGCALLVLTLCLYFGAKAYVRLTAEIREKDSLKSFGYFVMDRMPEDGAFATAFSNQEVIREASTRNLVLRASSPDGEVMKHDVKGSSFVAWSARPLNSCYRAFLSNGYAVYWLRDDEVSWYYQTFREKLTPAQKLEEQAYRAVSRPAEKVDGRAESRRDVAESFFAREMQRPGNIYDQGADSELVQKHWIPAQRWRQERCQRRRCWRVRGRMSLMTY